MANILALMLAGGRVDELDVLTYFRPKSVLPFGALYRIVDFPMSNLMNSGIEKVGILSQYRPLRLIGHIHQDEQTRSHTDTVRRSHLQDELSDTHRLSPGKKR